MISSPYINLFNAKTTIILSRFITHQPCSVYFINVHYQNQYFFLEKMYARERTRIIPNTI